MSTSGWFIKLQGSILESTVWVGQSKDVRLLWITMLALSAQYADGRVLASLPGLAQRAGLTLAETSTALQVLLSPDPYSVSKEFDGRRIEPVEGGWRILNAEKYRESRTPAQIKEAEKKSVQRQRNRSVPVQGTCPGTSQMSPSVPGTGGDIGGQEGTSQMSPRVPVEREREKEREQEKEEEADQSGSTAAAPAEAGRDMKSPQATAIEAALDRHVIFRTLDYEHNIGVALGLLQAGGRVEDIITATTECANKVGGLGLTVEAIQARLQGYWRAAMKHSHGHSEVPAGESGEEKFRKRNRAAAAKQMAVLSKEGAK